MKSNISINNFIEKAIGYASEKLGIERLDYLLLNKSEFPNKYVTAMYINCKNIILFNIDWINHAEVEEILITCFHESRHAYQWKVIQRYNQGRNAFENIDVIKTWKNNFENYIQPKKSERDILYEEQAIEIDAILFSKKLFREICE